MNEILDAYWYRVTDGNQVSIDYHDFVVSVREYVRMHKEKLENNDLTFLNDPLYRTHILVRSAVIQMSLDTMPDLMQKFINTITSIDYGLFFNIEFKNTNLVFPRVETISTAAFLGSNIESLKFPNLKLANSDCFPIQLQKLVVPTSAKIINEQIYDNTIIERI